MSSSYQPKHSSVKNVYLDKEYSRVHLWQGIPRIIFLSALALLGSFLFFTDKFLFSSWEKLSVDEILFHLRSSFEGTDTQLITRYLTQYLSLIIAFTVIVTAVMLLLRRKHIAFNLVSVAVFIASVSMGVYGGAHFIQETSVVDYLSSYASNEDFIESHYVDPGQVEIEFPDQKRNLIYIFLESVELTYANETSGGGFSQNVIPNLTDLALANECFAGTSGKLNGGVVLPGTNWTMGGMFAQTSGLPLKIALEGNNMSTESSFFPKATTIGDILKDQGYTNELLIGSVAAFGGRELYFRQHGNYLIHDRDYLLENYDCSSYPLTEWGLYDEQLFDLAREELLNLAAEDKPFNLTMLTLDTHFPAGFVCHLCEDEFGDNQYANVIACSDRQLTRFVEWIQEQDFYNNTTIVLCGDHETMAQGFCDGIPQAFQRKTFTAIINPAPVASQESNSERLFSTLDMFPTTLAALGVKIPGGSLGLGANLYSDTQTLLEQMGIDNTVMALNRQSSFLESLSGISLTERDFEITSEQCRIVLVSNDEGTMTILLDKAYGRISADLVKYFDIEVEDISTGQTESAQILPIFSEYDQNTFSVSYTTSFAVDDPENLAIRFYMTAGDFEHMLVKSYPEDE